MKKFFAVAVMTIILAQSASAALITKHRSYFHNTSGKIIDLVKVNEEEKTGVYYDHQKQKRIKVNLEDLSQEVDYAINGVLAGNFVLADIRGNSKLCQVYYVFENGVTRIGCQSGKITDNIGVDRPEVVGFTDQVSNLMGEVKSLNEFKKGQKVILKNFAGNIRQGSKVRIEVIFPNGEAVIQRVGLNLMDTSGILMKFNVERVQLSDLSKVK